jgi:acetate kinase
VSVSALVLVLNCGSSSIKFALFDSATVPRVRVPFWSGEVVEITGPKPRLLAPPDEPLDLVLAGERPYHAALAALLERLERRTVEHHLLAVAHRVVHGGTKYFDPVLVNAHVLADLRSYIPLAPLHQPFALDAIELLFTARPGLAQVACFDTGFHRTMPDVEKMLPLPYSAWQRGLRRYGFHGLSYEFMSVVLPEHYPARARGRTLVAHLGSGASLCAMRDLESLATTMGFSVLDGVMMGTRSGALDPGALLYLMEQDHLSPAAASALLYHESGLLGVSGVSSDPRALLAAGDNNPRINAALALYVRRIVREVGALVAVLGGLDLLVFTAGIGEHNPEIRRRVCAELGFLGVALDAAANTANAAVISSAASGPTVVVEPTNEEWIAARAVPALCALSGSARAAGTDRDTHA